MKSSLLVNMLRLAIFCLDYKYDENYECQSFSIHFIFIASIKDYFAMYVSSCYHIP